MAEKETICPNCGIEMHKCFRCYQCNTTITPKQEKKIEKCCYKGCKKDRYKNHFFCEKHWKERRENPNYKEMK